MQPRLMTVAAAGALALGLAAEAPAQSGNGPTIRNDSPETLGCRIYWRGRSRYERIVLRPGETWRPEAGERPARAVYCDPPAAPLRYRLRAGRHYRFVSDDDSVRIVLRGR